MQFWIAYIHQRNKDALPLCSIYSWFSTSQFSFFDRCTSKAWCLAIRQLYDWLVQSRAWQNCGAVGSTAGISLSVIDRGTIWIRRHANRHSATIDGSKDVWRGKGRADTQSERLPYTSIWTYILIKTKKPWTSCIPLLISVIYFFLHSCNNLNHDIQLLKKGVKIA